MGDHSKTIMKQGVEAALRLAAETGWNELTLSAIAEKAGLSLEDFHGVASKDTIADAVEGYFDKAMSEGSFDADETPRTRLFDVIMMRFEAMEAHRDALVSLMKWRQTQPVRLLNLVTARQASAEWALVCAGLDTSEGLPKPVKSTAIAWAIAQAERAWRKEDSADLSRTMARLDGELRKMEERASWITGRRNKTRPQEPSGDAETTTEHQPS
ncbi:TetR family transcriptional regulator [Henriciella sp.]|uniref:TetR family transcriptional regulator n=1 Tax=Henriciella sp. TaxID=1968823 RepID=UPI0026205E20|nr:TetR family transcriptional regulator [Henriciella sp.]